MNKFISKIVGVCLGLSLATGVGIGVAVGQNDVAKTEAAGEITAEKSASTLATEHSWVTASGSGTQTCYTSWALDSNVTISTSGSANCGSYWNDGWRLYQAQSGDLTITVANNYKLVSATFTYTQSNGGRLYDGSTGYASGSIITLTDLSTKTLTVGSSTGKTNGQVKISNFKVIYVQQATANVSIGGAAKINSSNSLSITATLTGVSGTPTWTASPSAGVSFTSGNPTTMSIDNTIANATVIEVTATVSGTTSNVKNVIVSYNAGSQQQPFEADEAVALIRNELFSSETTYYVSGYVKTSSYNSQYSNANIFISTSPNNTSYADTDCLELFRAVGDGGVDISNLQQGFYIVASGTMSYYEDSQPEFNAGCIVRSVVTPSVVVESVVVVADSSIDANGASFAEAEVEYDVTYSGSVGTKAVSVYIENSQHDTTGFEFTTPAGGSFKITFTANETYTIIVTSDEDDSISDSTTIIVTGIVAAVSAEFEKYSSSLVSGDEYVFISATYVMNNTISNDRVTNGTLPTISNDKFTTSDYSIVYIIAKVGNYYTIQNKSTLKYLAGTTAKNKAQFLDNATDDHTKWTISNSGNVWTFENLGRASDSDTPNNKYLRNNTTNGWACYGSSTGGDINLYHKVDTSRALTGLSVSTPSSKLSFNQGENLTVPSLVITATFSSNPTTIQYSGMTSNDSKGLTFSPALGSELNTTGTISISVSLTYNGHTESTSFNISVAAYSAPTYTKVTSSNVPVDLRGTYLVVYEDETDAYIMNSALGSSNSSMDVVNNYVSGTIVNNTITGSVGIDAAAVQIVRSDIEGVSKYFLKSSASTYYSATASKLNVESSPSASIEFSLTELNDGLRPHLGSNVIKFNSASNQMRFRVYATSGGSAEVSLYKLNTTSAINAEVNSFVSNFNDAFKSTASGGACNADGNSNITSLNNLWSSQATAFLNLSADAQGILACTTYTHNSEIAGSLADIVDRYDYIFSKYSASLTAGDFMNRSGLSNYQATGISARVVLTGVSDNSPSALTAIIVVMALTTTTVGAYFFLRKKKEN